MACWLLGLAFTGWPDNQHAIRAANNPSRGGWATRLQGRLLTRGSQTRPGYLRFCSLVQESLSVTVRLKTGRWAELSTASAQK